MIFEKVTCITSKEEFREKILIYIRLVEVIAEREKMIIPNIMSLSQIEIEEMQDMGIIENGMDLDALKKILDKNFIRFN